MKEIWKPIELSAGNYEVSNFGRFRRATPGPGTYVGRLLNPGFSNDGYVLVTLCVNGKQKTFSAHSLVAAAFIGSRPEGYEINHKDFDVANNASNNLEYATPKENKEYSRVRGRCAQKLSWAKVEKIREIYASGEATVSELAKIFKVHYMMIRMIIRNERWAV